MGRVFFFIAEAFRALRRSAAPSLAAIVTVVLTTLLLGVFIPVIKASSATNENVRQQLALRVFLKTDTSKKQALAVRKKINAIPHVERTQYISKGAGLKVSILPRIFEVVGSSVVFDHLEGLTVLGVRRFGLSRSSRALKSGLDLTGAIVGLVVLAPLLAIIAAAIKIDSRGPVFFRQTRVGRDGRHFQMLKFRTMILGADDLKRDLRRRNGADGLFKIADDPRLTRVGRLIRRCSLDELPQLLNVLRGEMSLVGPRPLVVDEDQQITGWHRRRLQLTPGMTGQWQVLGSGRIPLQDMVKIDYLYVANWTLWEDVKILLRTLAHMVARKGM